MSTTDTFLNTCKDILVTQPSLICARTFIFAHAYFAHEMATTV